MPGERKKVLISGIEGQDGTYLAEFLLGLGYEVHGSVLSRDHPAYLQHRNLLKGVYLHTLDVSKPDGIWNLLSEHRFDEIYNLASQSSPHDSFEKPLLTFDVNTNGVLHFLEAIRRESPETRFYQASSSELFGGIPEYAPQDENTRFHPRSPYGVSKLAAHWLVINFREAYNLRCCAGILFNHESPRRPANFVTMKICDWVRSYARGRNEGPLVLGNIEVKRDWGHSMDYVRAMWMMLNSDRLPPPFRTEEPVFREYVVGTGVSCTIKEFIEKALFIAGRKIGWKKTGKLRVVYDKNVIEADQEEGFDEKGRVIVTMSPELWRPAEVVEVRANPRKIRESLGWEPKISLDGLIREMLGLGG